MPELPDLEIYVEALAARIGGQVLRKASVRNPFVLRSVDPPLAAIEGRMVSFISLDRVLPDNELDHAA